MLPGQEPSVSQSRVVDVAKLVPGNDLVVEFDRDRTKEKVIFLRMQDGMEEERWFKLAWQNVDSNE